MLPGWSGSSVRLRRHPSPPHLSDVGLRSAASLFDLTVDLQCTSPTKISSLNRFLSGHFLFLNKCCGCVWHLQVVCYKTKGVWGFDLWKRKTTWLHNTMCILAFGVINGLAHRGCWPCSLSKYQFVYERMQCHEACFPFLCKHSYSVFLTTSLQLDRQTGRHDPHRYECSWRCVYLCCVCVWGSYVGLRWHSYSLTLT